MSSAARATSSIGVSRWCSSTIGVRTSSANTWSATSATAIVSREPPDWFRAERPSDRALHRTGAYLVLADGEIVLPLQCHRNGEWMATTVVLSYDVLYTDRRRAAKSAAGARKRAGRAAARMTKKKRGGRRAVAPDVGEWTT